MSKKKVILAVDDDPTALNILRALLTPHYSIITANSAANAIIVMNHTMPDMILLDIEMPEISGFEFLHTIKNNPKYMKIPVIIVSSHHKSEFVSHAKRSGAVCLIPKPVVKELLFEKIDYAFINNKTVFSDL